MNRKSTVREVGRRTRLKNRDVQLMLETLIDVWTEELVRGGRIELENFFVLETQTIDRDERRGVLSIGGDNYPTPRLICRLTLRASKQLKTLLNDTDTK